MIYRFSRGMETMPAETVPAAMRPANEMYWTEERIVNGGKETTEG
jgi:hypothetical protein